MLCLRVCFCWISLFVFFIQFLCNRFSCSNALKIQVFFLWLHILSTLYSFTLYCFELYLEGIYVVRWLFWLKEWNMIVLRPSMQNQCTHSRTHIASSNESDIAGKMNVFTLIQWCDQPKQHPSYFQAGLADMPGMIVGFRWSTQLSNFRTNFHQIEEMTGRNGMLTDHAGRITSYKFEVWISSIPSFILNFEKYRKKNNYVEKLYIKFRLSFFLSSLCLNMVHCASSNKLNSLTLVNHWTVQWSIVTVFLFLIACIKRIFADYIR